MTEPVRMCVGCRTRAPKRRLLQVIRRPDGVVVPVAGPRRRASGRGAYVCPRRACFDRAVRKGALARAVGRGRAVRFQPDDLWNALVVAARHECRVLRRTGASRARLAASSELARAIDREEGDV